MIHRHVTEEETQRAKYTYGMLTVAVSRKMPSQTIMGSVSSSAGRHPGPSLPGELSWDGFQ